MKKKVLFKKTVSKGSYQITFKATPQKPSALYGMAQAKAMTSATLLEVTKAHAGLKRDEVVEVIAFIAGQEFPLKSLRNITDTILQLEPYTNGSAANVICSADQVAILIQVVTPETMAPAKPFIGFNPLGGHQPS